MEPQIRFCTTSDGVRIAYAIVGEGPPIIRVQGWYTHLEYEWKSQYWRPLLEVTASQYLYVRYDGRGMGLSDRQVSDFSLEAHVRDLEAVIDAVGVERFGLDGISQGGPTAITYAVRYPERVTHLMLYGSYARPKPAGLDLDTEEGRAQFEAMLTLMRHGWGSDTPAFRQMFTGLFMPEADADSIREFNDMQRASTSAETAATLFAAMMEVDVTDLLARVSVPTLVVHRRGDGIVPFERGRQLATTIPGARFLPVEGNNHAILPHEPELLTMGVEIQNFIQGVIEDEKERRLSADVGIQAQSPIGTDLVGKAISHYRILEKLGEGGMGVVYKAEDIKLERIIALKFLSPLALGTEEEKIRFVREAKAAAALDHSSICHTYEIDEAEGQAFIAMAYVDGESLDKRVAAGPLDHKDAMEIAVQIAEGLRHAHRRGIVHRDIKPQNIILTEEGQAKILDFGLAKLTGKTRLTKTATIMGTVSYMSPEQARGESDIDHRTDIWALGVVLYEMLTGKLPFDAPSDAALLHKIIYEPEEPMGNHRPDLPPAMEQAVLKMMQKDAQDRYEDMEALISDLKSIRSGATPVIVVEEKTIPSIAVLPFADMSPQKDQEYFCDGISETIINELTQLSDLRVIARTSAFSFKGQNLDIREIGKKLNVGTVLEGSIQKAGDRVRVTAQLVNTTHGEHLWSEKYDRDMEDIFAIQDEISGAIVEKLKPSLLGKERAKLGKRQTIDLEAYNLYLKGRWLWNRMTADGIQAAINHFNQAIDKDPNYASAYAGLADSYIVLPFYAPFEPKKVFPMAREAVQKALELDEELAETHVALANIKMFYDWDWEGSERAFKHAITLNPGNANTHRLYATHLCYRMRFDEALEEMNVAHELDPLSLVNNTILAEVLFSGRRFDDAIQLLEKAVEMDPNYPIVHLYLGAAYLQKSRHEKALIEYEKERTITGESNPIVEVFVGSAYALMGMEEKSREVLDRLIRRSEQEYIPPCHLARIFLALGDLDRGFQWFDKAIEERDPILCYLKMDPSFDIGDIRSDPRYIAILKKIGLEKSDATVPMIEPSPSIAVLPFVNMSADPEQEYFCDGLAEELINALTQIKDLHVVARTSAFSFKGQSLDVRDIGKKLNVETVLEGSVRKAGNRLRITGQLVKVSDGYHLWSEKFDREMDDIFAIQDEIALAIVDKLKPKLVAGEKDKLVKRQTVDLEAYNLYLRGRYFIYKQSEEGLQKAIDYFQQAVDKQSDYALAYAGLADCYATSPFALNLPPKEFFPKAKEAALKALAIDETLAEAHTSLGFVNTMYDWDWDSGEEHFLRAIELNPGYALAHHWYALFLAFTGHFDEAIREITQALELDPFSLVFNRDMATVLSCAHQYDRAIEAAKKTIELDAKFSRAHLLLGSLYLTKSMFEEATDEFRKEKAALESADPVVEILIAVVEAMTGESGKAKEVSERLMERSKQEYVSPSWLAVLHFAFGEDDDGFKWLDRACEERDGWILFLNSGPIFEMLGLRSDPRYQAILREIGLDK